jgi:signal transduction histidine kinase
MMFIKNILMFLVFPSCETFATNSRLKFSNFFKLVISCNTTTNLRREFVANVSHELKTPITSIKGFAETLIEGAKNDEQSLDMFLNIILKESNRIESLVMDLLDLSHIEQQTENISSLNLSLLFNMR